MNWIILIFAAVAALVGGGLWWGRIRVGKELALMQATATSNARDVATIAPGTLVELKGALRCQAPLTSEFAQMPCVYYRALTEREVERVTTGSGGRRETRREYETESDNIRFAPAMLEDATGAVAIDFDGAKVEGEQVHQRRESAGLGTALVAGLIGAGTLAHRYTEWIVAADKPVYVLGTVGAGGRIGKSATKQPFVISIKSEEEREKSLTRTRLWLLIGTVVAAAATAGLLYWAAVAGPV